MYEVVIFNASAPQQMHKIIQRVRTMEGCAGGAPGDMATSPGDGSRMVGVPLPRADPTAVSVVVAGATLTPHNPDVANTTPACRLGGADVMTGKPVRVAKASASVRRPWFWRSRVITKTRPIYSAKMLAD
jgi:hypothetical protein